MKPEEQIVFTGKIGEVVHINQPDGRTFERFRRPPGTRLVIVSPDNQILITKEFRHETNAADWRLPGGKVCDTLKEYDALRQSGQDILVAAKAGAAREAREETGLEIHQPELIVKANAGATVEWDLYYFLVRHYDELPSGQALEAGEDIAVSWQTPAEIRRIIAAGQMGEWRSAGVLLGMVLPQLEQPRA